MNGFAAKRSIVGAVMATMAAVLFAMLASAEAVRADAVPNPGSPGPLFSPPFSASTFTDPGAALRPKFRWWQPVADTSDAQIRAEVHNMAADGGGGFEQNGFPATMNGGGMTPQFSAFANSQAFGAILGWGSAAWSERTATYQTAAARDGVIGDMNEGSRWNNTVPAVFSQNQPAAAQQLVFGDTQLKPGDKPGAELPPIVSTTTTTTRGPQTTGGLSGVSTTLCRAASAGDRNLQLASIAGLLAGDHITLGTGSGAETATIAHVGTASPCVPLSQSAAAGDSVVHVPLAPSDLPARNAGATSANLSPSTGVPGTGMQPAQFVPGEKIALGSGSTQDNETISSVGTFDMGPPTTLAADAPAGASNLEVTGNSGFLRGDTVTIDPGQPDQQSRTITSVGAAGTGTTLSQSAASGDLGIRVASTSGLAAGNKITIDPGQPDAETLTIASVSTAAAPAPNVLIQDATLGHDHAAGQQVVLTGIGVSFTPALSHAVNSAATVIDTGTGLKLAHPLTHAQPEGTTLDAPGTGVTLTAPLAKSHAVGPNTAPETTLAAGAASGSTTLEVASASGLADGDTLTIGSPGFTETDKIASIAAPTSAGTQLTLATPLTLQHYFDDPVVDAADRSGAATTLAAASFPGQTNIKLTSVAGLSPGDIIELGDPGSVTELAIIADGGVGTPGATGTGVTITKGLALAHADGQQVADNPAANASAGVSDIAAKHLAAVEFAQCADSTTDCPSAAAGGTRDLDPSTVHVVTGDVSGGTLHYPGTLPQGNGNPWEEIVLYQTADGQTLNGATATTPDYWLDHLSVTGAQAMADYFDAHILNDPRTQAAIRYQDRHNGTPAVFEDSLEDSQNLKWTNGMLSQWKSHLGYDPTTLLPAIAGENKNAIGTPMFDFTQNDGHGASLGWRVREDYRQMWNDLFTSKYQPTLDRWASNHGLVARFQSYGDPIDEGQAGATSGIPEGEHLEYTGNDETQQFKVVASGSYQSSNKVVSDECCEENGDAWADTFGVDGTGSGPEGSSILSNANSVYADMAGGISQIVWHGWPYTTGAGGRSAIWPGNTYGGDTSFSAANGPNQPQFSDDRQNDVNIARGALAIRQGQPSFDVAVYHQDLGLNGQGADTVTGGENLGNRVEGGVTSTPTTGKLIFSSSSLAQAGYTYGYVSPEFFRYPTATYGHAPGTLDPKTGRPTKVLFPGHGDYRSLVIYDQSVMPVDVARRILALARHGLPVVIIGQIPDATASASPGTVARIATQDAQVRAAMASLAALPNVHIVSDATATGSQSSDANAPRALRSLGIVASAALRPTTYPNALDQETMTTSTTATPVLPMRRYDPRTDTSYYFIYNPNLSATVDPTITLAGRGRPYTLDTWTAKVSPIADYKSNADRVRVSVRIAPGNFALIAVTPSRLAGASSAPRLHATRTTANATAASSDNVVYTRGGQLVARAARSGSYVTRLSDGTRAVSHITVPTITPGGGSLTLSDWQLWVDSWGPTPSGDPTQTAHTRIPVGGTFSVRPLSGVSDGRLPSWTAITPQNGFPVADNLTNVGGVGTYTTRFTLPSDWTPARDGSYLNIGVAVDTVDISINGTQVAGIDQNDRNQIDVRRYLRAGTNTLTIKTATPLRNAVAAAPATPATGQVPHDADPIGTLQGGTKEANIGLIGPVTLTPYGQAPLVTQTHRHGR